MNGWENFLLAQVGASAALAGLIFVGVSINLTRILSIPLLPNLAQEALIFLLTVLALSSVLLAPKQSLMFVGAEILLVGIVNWVILWKIDTNSYHNTNPSYYPRIRTNSILNQIAILPYVITGIAVLVWGEPALYGLIPVVLLSIFKAMLDAWVLLIEIMR
jgi:modulator of FtsH protease